MFKRISRGLGPRWRCGGCGRVFVFMLGWAVKVGEDPFPPPNYCPYCGAVGEHRDFRIVGSVRSKGMAL